MTESERKHTPFLEQVATHYLKKGIDLSNYCFVFPNRRSGQFFKDYFTRATTRKTTMLPEVETITDLVSAITGDIQATPIEAIFILYNAYKAINPNDSYQEFDKFLFWGNIVLSDFNDVDLYMVDPKQIFKNVEELREIGTDYLSTELKQAVEHLFKVHIGDQDSDTLWKGVKGQYLELWQQLHPLYEEFNKQLDQEGLSYSGRSLRKAADYVAHTASEKFAHEKYVFVGFNVLSKCEQEIFKNLKQKSLAEFCWDYNSPVFNDTANKATKFISNYIKDFPNAIDEPKIAGFPDIAVIGVPSNVGQAKYAFHVVDELVESKKIANAGNAIDTAIVLPDESLFIPLLNSMSDKVPNINVTLGYPLRGSSIVSLMRIVAKMHSQAWRKGGTQEFSFLKDDVKCVLSHPIIKSHYGPEATVLTSKIDNSNIYAIPESAFSGYGFEDLFKTIHNDKDKAEIASYIERIKHFVEKTFPAASRGGGAAMISHDSEEEPTIGLQTAFAAQYIDVLNEAKDAIEHYGIPMCEYSIFYLIDRLAGLYTIPFQGEPLAGLQVMGMLETRCLDFKNLIILSMSEHIFPRKFFSSSFIPVNMRRAYDMSTIEHQESMTAYYFYRLIGRAENVYLLYDTTTQSLGSGEYSRFIAQLDKIYGVEMHFKQLKMKIKPASSLKISIAKEGPTWDIIDAYRQEESGAFLSASSIKELIRCPLKFYFHHIQKLDDDNDDSEFMDASTFGSIVHDTLQQLYYPASLENTGKHNRVTKEQINSFLKSQLKASVKHNINRIYLHKKDAELDEALTGDAFMLSDALEIFVKKVLDHDLKLLEGHATDFFEIYECEQQHELTLQLPGARQPFNFLYRIDRVDKIGGKGPLRIIDYKTGSDDTKFSNVDDLADPTKSEKQAIMQLFLYCNAYAQAHPEEEEIQPVIYKLKDIESSGIYFGKNEITDFRAEYEDTSAQKVKHDVNVEFVNAIDALMADFFDQEAQLKQCDANQQKPPCTYCKFVEFCRR